MLAMLNEIHAWELNQSLFFKDAAAQLGTGEDLLNLGFAKKCRGIVTVSNAVHSGCQIKTAM